MLTQHTSAQQRRALNQIWNAAGEYGFDPLFLAQTAGGAPDLYMNTIVGCVRRWYGAEMPRALFGAWAEDRRQAMLDDLAWLALEHAVFEREAAVRPALAELRLAHARDFFAQEYKLSRQEWMAKNQLVYTMQAARWRSVLGQRPPVMTPYEKRLSDALACSGALDADALAAAVRDAFARFYLFDGTARARAPLRLHFDGKWASAMTKFMPTEIVHTDVLTAGHHASGSGGGGEKLDIRRARFKLNENAETDRAYIESCFGRSLYPPEELAAIEQQLCTGVHAGCHLWFTAGTPDPARARSGESQRLTGEAALQAERNRAAYAKDSSLYQNAILRLTEQIRNCIQVHSQVETETARSGRLDSPRVWRAAVVEDGRVFLREASDDRPGFSVDLLLDASSSRMHCQEEIAAQGYILAESLRQCGVPVRVTSFCSLRGYTVLRVLKGFADKNGSRKIFGYFASGWNRDGLVLRAAGELVKSAPLERRLVLLLTDASPNDSHRIPPGGAYPFGHDYADRAGVEDAAREVRALRQKNVRVAAVFTGEDRSAGDAAEIYGRSCARIRSMDQLAGAAGALIRGEIGELAD